MSTSLLHFQFFTLRLNLILGDLTYSFSWISSIFIFKFSQIEILIAVNFIPRWSPVPPTNSSNDMKSRDRDMASSNHAPAGPFPVDSAFGLWISIRVCVQCPLYLHVVFRHLLFHVWKDLAYLHLLFRKGGSRIILWWQIMSCMTLFNIRFGFKFILFLEIE